MRKYQECLNGILDHCYECEGYPYYTTTLKGYIIECDGCGQCMGPYKDKNQLGWKWNKSQRKQNKRKKNADRKRCSNFGLPETEPSSPHW